MRLREPSRRALWRLRCPLQSSPQEDSVVFSRSGLGAIALAILLRAPPTIAQSAPLRPPSSSRASLAEILRWADKNAPELAIARAGLSRGRAEIAAAEPLFPSDPTLGASFGRRTTGAGSGIDYEVSVEQEIEVFGERAARRRAARATMDLAGASVEQSRWRVRREVHGSFHDALVARAKVRSADRFVKFAEHFVQVAERKLAAGETSPLPVPLAESDLAEARQARIAAAQAERAAVLELKQVSGWPAERDLQPAGELGVPRDAPSVARLVQLARSQDPLLRARTAVVDRARAVLAAARREPWPNPRLGLAYARESEPGGSAATLWRGTVTVPIPVWQANRTERLRAQGELDVALAELGAHRRTIELRVRKAADAVNASAARVRVYTQKVLPGLEKNLSLVEKAFELGEIDATEVLVARERFLRSERTALDAREEYFRARGALDEAVGTELEDHHEDHATPQEERK
ncbi:MAG: TolC family protein [Myxococcales bacterium]|nr:TolC family protein [Myxococcales bacterium]